MKWDIFRSIRRALNYYLLTCRYGQIRKQPLSLQIYLLKVGRDISRSRHDGAMMMRLTHQAYIVNMIGDSLKETEKWLEAQQLTQ